MIIEATRCKPLPLPKPNSLAKKLGISYEKKVLKALMLALNSEASFIEHNPWFRYKVKDDELHHHCVPDIIIHFNNDTLIVAEVKLTFVPEALEKLERLYIPAVQLALNKPALPLVIIRNTIPTAPKANHSFLGALQQNYPLLQWLGNGQIPLRPLFGLNKTNETTTKQSSAT